MTDIPGNRNSREAAMSVYTRIRDARSRVNLRLFTFYLAIVLIIPAITTLIEYLVTVNPGLRADLRIDMQNFHLYQVFTSSFVHLNFDHFLANVTAYLLIAVYGLVLATLVNRKRLYLVASKIIVVIFVLFGAAFAIFNATTTYYAGLSGIDSALAGLLLLFWLLYLEHTAKQRMRHYYGLILFFILALSAGIVARYILLYHAGRNALLLSLLVFFVVLGALCVFYYRDQFFDLYRVLGEFSWSSRIITVAIIAIFAFFVWNLFPERLANLSVTAGIPLHLAGIVIGILAGYFLFAYLEGFAYFSDEKEVISR
jgi:membrane associated rhomboid family serine protease